MKYCSIFLGSPGFPLSLLCACAQTCKQDSNPVPQIWLKICYWYLDVHVDRYKSAYKFCLIQLKCVSLKLAFFYSFLNHQSTCSCSHKNCSKIHDKKWMEATFSTPSPRSTKIQGLPGKHCQRDESATPDSCSSFLQVANLGEKYMFCHVLCVFLMSVIWLTRPSQ